MHFRYLLILGLMLGATMFLPDYALAEKNELIGQQNAQKASRQVNTSAGIDKAAVKPKVPAKKKAVVMVPNPAIKNHGRVNQKQAEIPPNNPVAKKPVAASKNLPAQAKGNMHSVLNKTEKAVKDQKRKPENVAAVQKRNNGLEKNTATSESRSRNSTLDSIHITETDVNNQVQTVRFEPQGKDTHLSVAKRENRSESLVQKPLAKGDIPSGEEESPKVSQVPNSTQRTSGHGGKTNDRVSQGLNTISFLDKWFVWNPYYEIQLVHSYLSRHTWLNNQWVNAPPSPPPKEAPLLETVTRS